jgi:hypothetical protein
MLLEVVGILLEGQTLSALEDLLGHSTNTPQISFKGTIKTDLLICYLGRSFLNLLIIMFANHGF